MVLAAGFGTRMRPLTHQLPKALFPVMNRPALEHSISLLKSAGIADITVNLHHLGDQVTNHFGDGAEYGVRLHYSHEKTILGTGGGIKAAQKYLDGEPFIVVNSDVIVEIDLENIIRFHRENKSCLTLVLKKEDSQVSADPIKFDETGKVVHFSGASFKESPDPAEGFTFTGIQIMEPEIFDRIPAGKFLGTTESVFPKMVADGLPVYAYVHKGYWADIGRREDYLNVHKYFLSDKAAAKTSLSSTSPSGSNFILPVLVGLECQISETARVGPNVVLGKGCRVEDNAVVENSVCWDGAVMQRGAVVRESVIGTGSVIPPGQTVQQQLVASSKKPAGE